MINLYFANTAYAAPANLDDLIRNINSSIINPIIGVLFVFALVLFLWGTVKFIMNADNDTDREQGKNHMIWGLVGMFIMVSVVAIINMVLRTFGVSTI
jgi:uncharacterized membrane protein YbhN (UPF0104 family)